MAWLLCPAVIYVTHVKECDTAKQLGFGRHAGPTCGSVRRGHAPLHHAPPEWGPQPAPPAQAALAGRGLTCRVGSGAGTPLRGAVVGFVCLSQRLSPPGGACPRFPPGLPFWGTAGPRASPTLAGRVADRRPQARVHCPEVRGPRATAVGLPRPFLLREPTLGDTLVSPHQLSCPMCLGEDPGSLPGARASPPWAPNQSQSCFIRGPGVRPAP